MYAIAERAEMVDALKHWLVRPRLEQVMFDVECGYQANQQPLTPERVKKTLEMHYGITQTIRQKYKSERLSPIVPQDQS